MFVPFPHQLDCLAAIRAARQEGAITALVVMATGLGKTVTAGYAVKEWTEKRPGRVLYLCHQNDILYQSCETFKLILGHDRTYGYFHGEEKHLHEVDCLFASFQTMQIALELFSKDEFVYIIVDETHHSHAETFKPVIDYFDPEFLLGITATPDRGDGQNIRDIYGEEIFSLPLEEALARELLAPVDYRLLTDEIRLNDILETPIGKLSIKELNRKVFIPKRDDEIAKIIAINVAEFENPRVIVFCSSVQHCEHLAEFLPDAMAIHSRIPQKERSIRTEFFRQGVLGTVLTVDCFNEGIDVPEANVIVFLRSTASPNIFLQQLGRGLRKSDGKTKVIVLDFVGNCDRIKMLYDVWRKVSQYRENYRSPQLPMDCKTPDTGNNGPFMIDVPEVNFTEISIQVLDIINRIQNRFYPTWTQARESAIKLNIRSQNEYRVRYKEDERLPSAPEGTYKDFPGYDVYLGKYYQTSAEAAVAAQVLGIKSSTQYPKRYKEDQRLPSNPERQYEDFPGWPEFLGKIPPYKTWEEAASVAQKLRIPGRREYPRIRVDDPKLPPRPHCYYKDFPGWRIFLNTKFYESWQEAGVAARELGVTSAKSYLKIYDRDSKLPSSPHRVYDDFPGWPAFLRAEVVTEELVAN